MTWRFAVIVPAVALLGFGLLASVDRAPAVGDAPPTNAASADASVPARPGSPSAVTPAAVASHPVVTVYQCWRDGVRVLSDRACGRDAVRQDVTIDRMTTSAPPPIDTPHVDLPTPSADRAPAASDAGDSTRGFRCSELERRIEELNAAGRRPHDTFQADRLRAEWHSLRDEAHALGCPGR